MPEETYRTIIEQIARRKSSSVTVFADFCRMVACALAMQTREEEYFETIKGYSQDELELLSKAMGLLVMEMEKASFTDVLGTYYTEISSRSTQQARGEFYTPQEISRMMAKMTINAEEVKERSLPITVNEPTCGAGGMVLAIAEEFAPDSVDLLRATCQDINPVAADMCYINTTLWGIPAHIIQGNALSNEIVHSWKNIHWARVGEDQRQAFKQMMNAIASPVHKAPSAPEPKMEPIKGNQAEFDFDLGQLSTPSLT